MFVEAPEPPIVSDDDVLDDLHADDLANLRQVAREREIGVARRRIPARMIVQQDDGRRRGQDGRLEHFARVHEAGRQRALGDHHVAQQAVLGVEQRYPEDLARQILHEGPEGRVDLGVEVSGDGSSFAFDDRRDAHGRGRAAQQLDCARGIEDDQSSRPSSSLRASLTRSAPVFPPRSIGGSLRTSVTHSAIVGRARSSLRISITY